MAYTGVTSLSSIRTAIRQRADFVNSTYFTDSELNGYINLSYAELYDLLIQKFGDDYYVAIDPGSGALRQSWQFQTDGINNIFPLPDGSSSYAFPSGSPAPALYKLLGVDLQLSGTPDGWLTVKPFQFIERNRYAFPNVQAAYGLRSNLKYKLHGSTNIMFTPIPAAGQTIQCWYIPRLNPLSDSGTATVASVIAGDTLTINGTVLTASASVNTGTNFQTNASNTVVATNLAACITRNFSALPASGSLAVVTVTPTNGAVTWFASSSTITLSPAGWWSPFVDGVSGWEEYIICDVAIKCLAKEESDASVFMAQKLALEKRIEAAAENRDAGSPQTVADARRGMLGWPEYEGGPGSTGGW